MQYDLFGENSCFSIDLVPKTNRLFFFQDEESRIEFLTKEILPACLKEGETP